jgi:hypothetical protein
MSDPYSSEWSEEEIATLPQTEKVFEAPKLTANEHEWQQQGYIISDNCQPKRANCPHVGIPIPSGKLLIKNKNGGYELVNERR